MRVATKIVALTTTLIALLVLVLALQLWWVERLAAVTESLPATTFRVGAANLALSRSLLELREFSRKVEVSGADYLAAWEAQRTTAREHLRTLAALPAAAFRADRSLVHHVNCVRKRMASQPGDRDCRGCSG